MLVLKACYLSNLTYTYYSYFEMDQNEPKRCKCVCVNFDSCCTSCTTTLELVQSNGCKKNVEKHFVATNRFVCDSVLFLVKC